MTYDAIVLGGGGFIGGHLVRRLTDEGKTVLSVDKKSRARWYQKHEDENVHNTWADISDPTQASYVMEHACEVTEVYDLAADMGGIGFIEDNKLDCMLSVITGVNALRESANRNVERFFFSSSACAYAAVHQTDPKVTALREEDAYPAMPEDGYGWEKLFTERLCRHFREDRGLETRIARYHNIYGPYGTWQGGREKAPAAACRKVAIAALTGAQRIEVWGDGEQTRSFTYIDDCVEGTLRIARSNYAEPLNLGSSHLVSINELFRLVADVAGREITLQHIPGPEGVRGRNSDNARIIAELDWEPTTSLREGIEQTYRWVYDQVSASL